MVENKIKTPSAIELKQVINLLLSRLKLYHNITLYL